MKVLKRVGKVVAYVGTILIVLVVLLTAFTQTRFFRERIRIILVSSLSAELNGRLELGVLRGNFLTGFSFDSVAIDYQDQPFLRAGQVRVEYEPLALLDKRISIRQVSLASPKVHFVRAATGVWNFEALTKPSDDTTMREFSWTIQIARMELRNGLFTLVDSAAILSPEHRGLPDSAFIEYHDFAAKDVNLTLSGEVRKDDYRVHIQHMSLYSDRPAFGLTHLSGRFTLSDSGVYARNVVIQTNRSYLELDAAHRGPNLIRGTDLSRWGDDSLSLTLHSRNIDFVELKTFLPPLDFLRGSASLQLEAGGEFGDLNVHRLKITTFGSVLNVSGEVVNLHQPGKLAMDLFLDDGRIVPSDLHALMPSMAFPDLDSLGITTMFARFTGKPLEFSASVSAAGAFGSVEAKGNLNFARTLPSYDLTFSTGKVRLEAIAPRTGIRSVLSSVGQLRGEGISIDSLTASLSMQLASSRVHHLTVDSGQLAIHARARRLEGSTSFHARSAEAVIKGMADFSKADTPEFETTLLFNSVDLATVFGNPSYRSDLTLQGTVAGSGKTVDGFSCEADLTLFPSTFHDHALPPEEFRLSLDQRDPSEKHLSLRSSIADLDCSGRFDIDLAVAALARQMGNLIEAVSEHTLPPESPKPVRKQIQLRRRTPIVDRSLDFNYSVSLKTLEPVASLLEGAPFDLRGDFHGSVFGTDQALSVSTEGTIEEFFVGTFEKGVLFSDGTIQLRLDSLTEIGTLEEMSGSFRLTSEKGVVNSALIESLNVAIDYRQPRGTIALSATIDSAYRIGTQGQISVQPGSYVMDFDRLRVSSGGYTWMNEQDVQLRLNAEGMRVMHADMRRVGAERVTLAGSIRHSGEFDLTAAVQNFDLSGLHVWIQNPELERSGELFRGRADANVQLTGTAAAPVFTMSVKSESTYIRRTSVGTVQARILYDSSRADVDVMVRKETEPGAPPSLTIIGTVPINLAFGGVSERFPDELQDLRIVSQGFDLSILDPIIRELDNLSGTAIMDVTLGGTPRDPSFRGTITLNEVNFIFTPNNIAYSLSGELEPREDRIVVKSLVLKNLPERNINGETSIQGSITMRDFKIDSYDLKASGSILLMSDATRKVQSIMYGTLFTEIDPAGLHISGSLRRPYLSGNLYVREANLTFPATKTSARTASQFFLNYYVIDDTTRRSESIPQRTSRFYQELEERLVSTSLVGHATSGESPEPLFLDRLRYNLTIETRGPAAVRMIFTPTTNEELYAELEGRVAAVNEQGTANVYGRIAVTSQSYYNFIKRFNANGTLNFVGPWDNPELDIQAAYENYHQIPDSMRQANGGDLRSNEERIIVELTITGTRNEPKLEMAMKIQRQPGEDPVDWSTRAAGSDVQSNAISFILTGKFRDELTSRERENIATNFGSAGVSGLTSTLLSGILTDFLKQEFPFIRSAEVTYGGGSLQESADVRLRGEAFTGYWQFGGRILNNIGNANVTYQLSLGNVLGSPSIRNLFLELERRVEGTESFGTDKSNATNSARLYYRFSF